MSLRVSSQVILHFSFIFICVMNMYHKIIQNYQLTMNRKINKGAPGENCVTHCRESEKIINKVTVYLPNSI